MMSLDKYSSESFFVSWFWGYLVVLLGGSVVMQVWQDPLTLAYAFGGGIVYAVVCWWLDALR